MELEKLTIIKNYNNDEQKCFVSNYSLRVNNKKVTILILRLFNIYFLESIF